MANELSIGMEIDGERFKSAQSGLNALAGLLAVPFSQFPPIARQTMSDVLDGVIDAMDLRHAQGFRKGKARPSGPGLPRGPVAGRLQVRSGKLIRDLRKSKDIVGGSDSKTSGEDVEVTGRIALSGYGAVHETGATIKPRKSQYLAIPFDAALDASGKLKKKPRAWKNTFVLKSRKGNLIIMQKRRGKLVPLFLLKKKVKIPPRLGLGITMEKAAPVFVDLLFERLVAHIRQARPRDAKGRFI